MGAYTSGRMYFVKFIWGFLFESVSPSKKDYEIKMTIGNQKGL